MRSREAQLTGLCLPELAGRLDALRSNSLLGYDELFLESAATIASAIRLVKQFRLHDVQVAGAGAAASGSIIEMQTGEGKTIVCAMTALLRSVFDSSVHVATTNDYLAERDFEENLPLFEALGTSSGLLQLNAPDNQLKAAYRSHITYGPGYLFGFDYLRDQTKIRKSEELILGRTVLASINGTSVSDRLVQTTHQTIIVDEADSVLLDEASTPLILSEPQSGFSTDMLQPYVIAFEVAQELATDEHFTLDPALRRVHLKPTGEEAAYDAIRNSPRLSLERPWSAYVENALFAQFLLLKDEHYVVDGQDVKLVDQFTGRILDDRQLRGGLHQAVEAKEGLPVKPSNRTTARLTRQTFFGLYDRVCGMTGTISGNEAEVEHFYDAKVAVFKPNIPTKREAYPTRMFGHLQAKLSALCEDICERLQEGRPLLVGTRTIQESLEIGQKLDELGLTHTVLNGIQDQEEAEIIAQAGKVGMITIATNMAGRGTDIKLSPEARELGGLHVLCTQHHTSKRVDRQLVGRAARQGDPGSYQFWICAEDDLFQRFAPKLGIGIAQSADNDGNVSRDFSAEISALQDALEAEQYSVRRSLVKHDLYMDQLRETMVQA